MKAREKKFIVETIVDAKLRMQIKDILPSVINTSLLRYSRERLIEKKFATRNLVTGFEFFSDRYTARADFKRLFVILFNHLYRQIPYLRYTQGYLRAELFIVQKSQGDILLYLNSSPVVARYMRYINHLARKINLPLQITWNRLVTNMGPSVIIPTGKARAYKVGVIQPTEYIVNLPYRIINGYPIYLDTYIIFEYLNSVFQVMKTISRLAMFTDENLIRISHGLSFIPTPSK